MTQQLPPQLSHFGLDVVGVLGEGGMGVVYRVHDRRLNRDAALKLIRAGETGIDPRAINRFRREVLITARLDHPGIPPVYDSGTDPQGQPYMLMQVVEGRPLHAILKEHHEDYGGTMSRRELLEVLVKIGEAVAYAHTQEIVHRDLKPANVMVGRFGEVLVMDWGLARELGKTAAEDAAIRADVANSQDDEAQGSGMTLQGAVVGTPGYMPPEQAEGEAVDERADVFALGSILSCILTGRPPIDGASSVNRLVATIQGQIHTPRERDRSVPRELDAIAAAALAAEPSERTPSVAHFLRDLRAYLAGDLVGAYDYSARERLRRWLRAHVSLVVGVGLLLLTAAGLIVAAAVVRDVGRRAASAQREADQKAAAQAALAASRAAEKERLEQALEELGRAREQVVQGQSLEQVRETISGALANVRTRFTLNHAARVYEELGALDDAQRLLEEAAEAFPPAYRELFALHVLHERRHGQKLGTRRDKERGGTVYLRRLRDRALERGEENQYTLFTKAQAAFEADDLPEALRLYTRSIERWPRFVWALSNRATVYLLLGQKQKALADAQRAVELDPRFAPAVATRAGVRLRLGDHMSALADVTLAIALQPELAQAYVLRAQVRLEQANVGREPTAKTAVPAEVLADLDKALKLDPDHPQGLVLRARIRLDQRKLEAARRDVERSLRVTESMEGFAIRGLIHAVSKDYDAAERDLVRALQGTKAPDQRQRLSVILEQVRAAKRKQR